MLMALFVYAIIGICGYIWLTRGFFSALIHLACTIAAGAIALGVWEPLGYLIINNAPDRGIGTFLRDAGWGLALAAPFCIALALLRLATNKLLIFNAQGDKVGDAIGGLVCGLGAGVITAGFFMMSVGMLRVSPESLGYTPVSYTTQATSRGAIEREPGYLVGFLPRADLLTAKFYGYLSKTTLRTGEPLAKWHPALADEIAANRLTHEGKSRNTLKSKDFQVNGWYTIGLKTESGAFDTSYAGKPIGGLLGDQWNTAGQAQGPIEIDGSRITGGYVAGFQVQVLAGAREKFGAVLFGAGQVKLVVAAAEEGGTVSDHDSKVLFPVAVVSAMDVTNLEPGQEPAHARFRYDGNDVYVASVGGASDALMTFEFAVPAGYRPIGLYLKGARWEVPEGQPTRNLGAPAERDAEIIARGGVYPTEDIVQVAIEPIAATNSLGFVLQSGTEKGLEIYSEGNNNWVRNGEEVYPKESIGRGAGMDRALRIDRFEPSPDTVIVKVNVSRNSPASILGEVAAAVDPNQPLVLVDTNGTYYEPVGYIYKDDRKYQIRYTVGRPVRSLQELQQAGVSLSTSRADQDLVLVFRVTYGSTIRAFQIGSTPIYEIDPPMVMDQRQK